MAILTFFNYVLNLVDDNKNKLLNLRHSCSSYGCITACKLCNKPVSNLL